MNLRYWKVISLVWIWNRKF